MTTADFEELLARQCAPTFIGLKAASLVAFQKDRFDDLDAQLADYEPCFACHGISMFRLLDEESRALCSFIGPTCWTRFFGDGMRKCSSGDTGIVRRIRSR